MKDFNIGEAKAYEIPITDLKIHRIAELNPMMEEEQYNALREDIRTNGQLVPAIIYRGKIIDGRHRLLALKEIGKPTIRAVKLPNNYSLKSAVEVIESMETRRHQDKTAMAIKGWRLWKEEGYSRVEAAQKVGVAPSLLSFVEQIYKLDGNYLINSLWEGNYYIKANKSKTRSLPAIVVDLKAKKPKTTTTTYEEEQHPLYGTMLKIYEDAPPGVQDALYEAIRAKRLTDE